MSKVAERGKRTQARPSVPDGNAKRELAEQPGFPDLPLHAARRPRHPSMTPYPRLLRQADPALPAKAQHFAKAWMARLRAWRVEQSLTREALAELSGLPVSAIKRAERDGEIQLTRFLALALSLGLESELSGQFIHRRVDAPAVVLLSRMRRRQRGWRRTHERHTRNALRPRDPA